MKDIQLPNRVSGEKLVQMLERASSESGFEFRKVDGERNSFPDYLATYREPKSLLNAFSDKPSLQLRFVDIESDKPYSSVKYHTEVYGFFSLKPQEIDIGEDISYKEAHGKFFRRLNKID